MKPPLLQFIERSHQPTLESRIAACFVKRVSRLRRIQDSTENLRLERFRGKANRIFARQPGKFGHDSSKFQPFAMFRFGNEGPQRDQSRRRSRTNDAFASSREFGNESSMALRSWYCRQAPNLALFQSGWSVSCQAVAARVWTNRRKWIGNLLPTLFFIPPVIFGVTWMNQNSAIWGKGLWLVVSGTVLGWIALNFFGLWANGFMKRTVKRELTAKLVNFEDPHIFVGFAKPRFFSMSVFRN